MAGRRLINRAARALVVACAAVGLALGVGTAPATAAPVDVLLSTDGVTFSSALSEGMFDDLGLLVPGESMSSSLWVRNPTPTTTVLRVSARDLIFPSVAFAGGVTMTVWDSGTGTTRSATLGALARCDILVPSQPMAAGATIRLDVTFTMADLTSSVGQNQRAGLGLMVAMRDGEAGSFATSACDDEGVLIASNPSTSNLSASNSSRPTTIAHTGTDLPVPLFIAGGLLLGVGIFLVAGRRRRERDES